MILIEQIINSSYIKYDRMIPLVNSAFAGSTSDTVNIYVDLYSILKPLYQNEMYKINDFNILTSCLVNLVSHYRSFFRTRFRVETNFYLILSKNCPYINKQFVMEYNAKNEGTFNAVREKDELIQYNAKLLNTLCPYLPNVYFIESQFETSVVVHDLISRGKSNQATSNIPSIILTKDKYCYQLPAIHDDVVIFRPKKKDNLDYSYYINKHTLYATYLTERKIDRIKINPEVMPGLLSLIMSLSSVKERNIKSLMNINTVLKTINHLVSTQEIVNGYNYDLTSVSNNILKFNNKVKFNTSDIERRFKSIDIIFQHSVYINTQECMNIESKLVDLYDPEAVKYINNIYFKENPLDLERL